MNYFKDSSERVLAAYGATSRGVFTGDLGTAYNSFLLQLNWLKLYNVTGSTAEATITAYSSSGAELGQAIIELAANSGSDMEVRNTLGLPIPLDTYGFLRIEPNPAGSIFGETVRVKPHSSKLQTDLTASIPAR